MDDDKRRKHREYMRKWRAEHADNREYQREYHARYMADPENREKSRQKARESYRRRAEEVKVRHRKAHAENPGRAKAHAWIKRELGEQRLCEVCGSETARTYDWANLNHQYRHDVDEWKRMCRSCHRKHDVAQGLFVPRGRPRL